MGNKKWSGLGAIFLGHGGWSLPGAPHFPLYQRSQQNSTGVRGSSPGGTHGHSVVLLGQDPGLLEWRVLLAWGICWGAMKQYGLPSRKPVLLPLTLLLSPPQKPRAPRAHCLALIYSSCEYELGALRPPALPEPSREELMEDLAEDADAHQPGAPAPPLEIALHRRLQPWEEITPASINICQQCHHQCICFLK